MMPRVWIANARDSADLSDALRWGAPKSITEGTVDVFRTEELMATIGSALDESGPGDYLLLCGSAVICALCAAAWVVRHGSLRILIYGHRDKKYEARDLELTEVE